MQKHRNGSCHSSHCSESVWDEGLSVEKRVSSSLISSHHHPDFWLFQKALSWPETLVTISGRGIKFKKAKGRKKGEGHWHSPKAQDMPAWPAHFSGNPPRVPKLKRMRRWLEGTRLAGGDTSTPRSRVGGAADATLGAWLDGVPTSSQ